MKPFLFGAIIGISSLASATAWAASCPSTTGDTSQLIEFAKKSLPHIPSGDVDISVLGIKDSKKSSLFLVQFGDLGKQSAVGIVSCDKSSGDLKVLGNSWNDAHSDGVGGSIITQATIAAGNSGSSNSSHECSMYPGTTLLATQLSPDTKVSDASLTAAPKSDAPVSAGSSSTATGSNAQSTANVVY